MCEPFFVGGYSQKFWIGVCHPGSGWASVKVLYIIYHKDPPMA